MNTSCMPSALLLLLLTLFISSVQLQQHSSVCLGLGLSAASTTSIAGVEGKGSRWPFNCWGGQLLGRPQIPLSTVLLHQVLATCELEKSQGGDGRRGVKCSSQRRQQLAAFLTHAGASAAKRFTTTLPRHSSPVSGTGGGKQPISCGSLQCRGGGLLLKGLREESFNPISLYTGTNSVLFAGGNTGLAKIPLSTKQLKRREQAERKAAESSHVKEREAVEDKEGAEKRRQRVKDWRVVLHNDDIHTFECVEDAITKVLPHISRARAYDIALHAHTNSKATIMLTWEEKATEVAMALQGEGLTVSVLPDKLFNKQEEQQ